MTRIYFRYAVDLPLCYLSHLDLIRLFHRALRRTALPLDYSKGFNPHPRLSLAVPLPVGVTGAREYGEVYLTGPVTPGQFLEQLRRQLPGGLTLHDAVIADPGGPPLAAVIDVADYEARPAGLNPVPEWSDLQRAVTGLLSCGRIVIRRREPRAAGAATDGNTGAKRDGPGSKRGRKGGPGHGKAGKSEFIDIRPYILDAKALEERGKAPFLILLLQVGSAGGVSPFRVLEQLRLPAGDKAEDNAATLWRVHRRGLYIRRKGGLAPPFPG